MSGARKLAGAVAPEGRRAYWPGRYVSRTYTDLAPGGVAKCGCLKVQGAGMLAQAGNPMCMRHETVSACQADLRLWRAPCKLCLDMSAGSTSLHCP
jgi:hypothetical protein